MDGQSEQTVYQNQLGPFSLPILSLIVTIVIVIVIVVIIIDLFCSVVLMS